MDIEKQYLGKIIGLLRSRMYHLQQVHNNHLTIKMTVEESVILNMLRYYGKPTIQEISLATNKNKSVVLRMIDSLERKGLVTRTVNPDDRREKLLHLTRQGNELVDQGLAIKREIGTAVTRGISDEDMQVFLKVAKIMQSNLDSLVYQQKRDSQ